MFIRRKEIIAVVGVVVLCVSALSARAFLATRSIRSEEQRVLESALYHHQFRAEIKDVTLRPAYGAMPNRYARD